MPSSMNPLVQRSIGLANVNGRTQGNRRAGSSKSHLRSFGGLPQRRTNRAAVRQDKERKPLVLTGSRGSGAWLFGLSLSPLRIGNGKPRHAFSPVMQGVNPIADKAL